jgi:histidinol dehydrogenase
MTVMRRQQWTEMDAGAAAALFDRGLADIFDPALRTSIGELIDDVRARGDAAVCDALARFDGVELDPAGLRVSNDEIAAAVVSDDVDRAIDHAISNLRRFNEAQLAHHAFGLFQRQAVFLRQSLGGAQRRGAE